MLFRSPPHDGSDEAIFDALYRKNVESKNFRARSPEELQELKKYVHLLKVSNSVLGAFALIPRGGSWMEFATMCSDYNGSGIGDAILQEAQKRAKNIFAFASSPESAALFARNLFENLGPVSALQKEHPAFFDCLPCIAQYDVKKRDPCFCTWHKEEAPSRT